MNCLECNKELSYIDHKNSFDIYGENNNILHTTDTISNNYKN